MILMSLANARTLVEHFEEEARINRNTETMEFSLLDPDGYYVTVGALNP